MEWKDISKNWGSFEKACFPQPSLLVAPQENVVLAWGQMLCAGMYLSRSSVICWTQAMHHFVGKQEHVKLNSLTN